jgi:predicted transcriptional regulator of viral defense system
MNYNKFRQELKEFPVFSLRDVSKLSEKIYHHRLVDWQKNGYIERIANGYYKFADVTRNEFLLFYLANRIYEPSYISLETALSYYGLIPEAVFNITSVCTKKTTNFNTNYTSFQYSKLKNSLFFGYTLINNKNMTIKMAEPEKAVLDLFYLKTFLNSTDQIHEFRLNVFRFNEIINRKKMNNYMHLIDNKNLIKRIELLFNWIDNAGD